MMNPYQSWQDTVCLLAGARVPRTARPGERFEITEKHRNRLQAFIQVQVARIILLLRLS